jgi:MATE family multidrug resistance protein
MASSAFPIEARKTLLLAVPIMAGQLSQMLMGVLDSAMVGRVGVIPLAASAFANGLLGVPFLFGIGLLQAISVRVSQAHGAGDREETGEMLRHGLAITGVAGVALVVLIAFASMWLGYFGQPAEVAREARVFFLLVGGSMLPMLLAMSVKQYSEALNHPWPPMLILLGSVGLNAVLNWILIYGNLGAPVLGLTGAGCATLLSRIAAVIALTVYVSRARRFAGTLPAGWLRPLHWTRICSLLRIGLPASGQLLLEVTAFSMATIMMGWLGAVALAAHQIALSCAATTFMFPLGISMATTIRIGQALGAGEHIRVRIIGLSSFALGFLIMSLAGVIFAVGNEGLAHAFVKDPDVTALAARLLIIAAFFQIFDGLQVVGAGALRGLSDATVPMVACLIAYWLVFLPFAWLAAFRWELGAVGIWMGFVMSLGIVALSLLARFVIKSAPRRLAADVPSEPVVAH